MEKVDNDIIGTMFNGYYVVGRAKSDNRHLACIHQDNFAGIENINNISVNHYVLLRYCTMCDSLKVIEDFTESDTKCKGCSKGQRETCKDESSMYNIFKNKKRKDNIIIGTLFNKYYVIGRSDVNVRHLVCVHQDNFADNEKINVFKNECYILKRYCNICETLRNIDDFNKSSTNKCKSCEKNQHEVYNKS